MIRSFVFCSLAIGLLCASPLFAVDGIAIGIHFEKEGMGNIHDASIPGRLMRYDVQNDKVIRTLALYEKTGVCTVCLSPFGDRVAFTRADGTIAVVSIDGGDTTELGNCIGDEKPNAKDLPTTGLQWPASEGGQWIYYSDARRGGANDTLRRINVRTKQDEAVIHFNRKMVGGFALSLDATPHSGKLVKRTDNYTIAIYDMARGDGDLFACPRTGGCGESISPDGSLLTANAGDHASVNLVDVNGLRQGGFRLSEWDGDPCNPALGLKREQLQWAWQAFRWSVNAMNWIAVTQGKLKLGSTHETYFQDLMLYDWVHHAQINVTHNGIGKFDRAGGFFQTGAKQEFLGYFSGKAPFTVEINDARIGTNASWDFGDGSSSAGPSTAKHTFEKAGSYTLTATQGGRTFAAQVQVQQRRAPTATACYVNDHYLLVDFDEPVHADHAEVRRDSGLRNEEWELDSAGRRMIVHSAGALTFDDQLHLTGFFDAAQVPNSVAAKPIPVIRPAWPTDRTGLVYLWEDGKKINAVYDAAKDNIRELRVSRDSGIAGIDRYGRMRFDGGRISTGFFSQSGPKEQFVEVVKADAFSLEATIQSNDLSQEKPTFPARIINISAWHDWDCEFLLGQQKDRLVVGLRTTDNMQDEHGKPVKGGLHARVPLYEIYRLPDTLAHHVIISYVPGKFIAYVDGKQVYQSAEITGSLKAWGYGELCFGANHNSSRYQWLGKLEGVAIYNRFIGAEEAGRNFATYSAKLKARKIMPQLTVEAKLLATSVVPDRRRIAPYHDALVINEYQVTQVVGKTAGWTFASKIESSTRIRVAQWGLIDEKPTDIAQAKIGDVRKLVLETYEKHPDKIDEVVTSNSLDIDPDVPMLYEPRP